MYLNKKMNKSDQMKIAIAWLESTNKQELPKWKTLEKMKSAIFHTLNLKPEQRKEFTEEIIQKKILDERNDTLLEQEIDEIRSKTEWLKRAHVIMEEWETKKIENCKELVKETEKISGIENKNLKSIKKAERKLRSYSKQEELTEIIENVLNVLIEDMKILKQNKEILKKTREKEGKYEKEIDEISLMEEELLQKYEKINMIQEKILNKGKISKKAKEEYLQEIEEAKNIAENNKEISSSYIPQK